jgi:hypothetical protein
MEYSRNEIYLKVFPFEMAKNRVAAIVHEKKESGIWPEVCAAHGPSEVEALDNLTRSCPARYAKDVAELIREHVKAGGLGALPVAVAPEPEPEPEAAQ